MSGLKQIIVMRTDLGMRKGKMVAQGAHASVGAIIGIHREDPRVAEWLAGSFTKICVGIGSEQELLDIHERAVGAGLIGYLIRDNGVTEFGGVPTYTCCAIGPDLPEDLDPITGGLKLL
mgnify:CR=1 FL=1